MEGWVGLVCWPIADTLPTKWSHVKHRSSIVCQPNKTDVITTEQRRQPCTGKRLQKAEDVSTTINTRHWRGTVRAILLTGGLLVRSVSQICRRWRCQNERPVFKQPPTSSDVDSQHHQLLPWTRSSAQRQRQHLCWSAVTQWRRVHCGETPVAYGQWPVVWCQVAGTASGTTCESGWPPSTAAG